MIRSRFLRGAAIAVAATLTLSACADRTAPDDGPDAPTDEMIELGYFPNDDPGEPTQGGTLTYADLSEVRSLDPSAVISTGASGGSALVAVFDQITRFNFETQEYEPRLAESVEPNDDFTEWTIKVRPDVSFSDGTPLNADAVVGSMNWYTQTQSYEMSLVGPLWGGVEKIDDMTVKITLKDSWANFESMLARSLGFIVAPAAIAGDEFTPIGAGAFTFDSYAPTEELILKANPNYWDGAPYVDNLRFVWLGSDQTRQEAFNGGSVQAAYVQDPNVLEDVVDEGHARVTSLSGNGQLLLINHAPGNPGEYLEVRQALAYAIDIEGLDQRVYGGAGVIGKTLFAPISRWHDDSVEVNDYDPERARELVEEAKAAGYDGKLELLAADSPAGRETLLTIQGYLESVGFEVETEIIRNLADYISRLYVERSYSVTTSGLSIQEHDPWMQMYLSMHSAAPSNITGNNDPEMDALLDELRVTPLDDAQDVITRIEQHYQEAVPSVNYRYLTPTIMWQENVNGIVGLNETMVDFSKAWVTP